MSTLIGKLNYQVKNTSSGLLLYSLRLIAGLIIGITFALIGEVIIGYGSFTFIFVTSVFTLLVLKISKSWGYVGLGVFALISFLLGGILKMYIIMGPGA